MKYRCVATTPQGLVQQVAVSYLRHGYWWYVAGRIPHGKDGAKIDQKLVSKYEIDLSERQRAGRKSRGLANMQYIRFEHWFLLLATAGHHSVKLQEQLHDCRRHPIRFDGYSISYRQAGVTPKGNVKPKWHACVRIEPATYKQLKNSIVERSKHRSASTVIGDLNGIQYARYAPVRRQILNIHRAVNRARGQAGFDLIPTSSLVLKRKIVLPFGEQESAVREVA